MEPEGDPIELRVFQPEAEPGSLDSAPELPPAGDLSLAEYYARHILPARRLSRSKRTLADDQTALKRWREYGTGRRTRWDVDSWGRLAAESHGPRIPDPSIAYVTDSDLVDFVSALFDSGLARATVALTCRHLAAIFSHAWGDGSGALLKRPRFPDLPAAAAKRKWIPSADDVSKVFRAALAEGEPQLAALVMLAALFGLRPEDLAALRWEQNLNGELSEICWTPAKTVRHRPEPMVCPVPDCLRGLLERIRKPSGRLFWSQVTNLRRWRALVRGAGFQEIERDSVGRKYLRFSLKTLRRFANARANAIRAGAGNWILGHGVTAGQRINHLHYSDCYQCPDWVAAVLNSEELAEPFAF